MNIQPDPYLQCHFLTLSPLPAATVVWDGGGADPGVVTNSGVYDKVIGNGGGTATLNVVLGSNLFTSAFWNTRKTWTDIFSGTDPIFSIFGGGNGISSVSTNGTVPGRGQFSYAGSTLSWTAIPEPTTALVAILLGSGLMRRRREFLSGP